MLVDLNVSVMKERTDASTDCGNVKLFPLLHVRLNSGKRGCACVGVHDGTEGLEGPHDGGLGVRHFLLSFVVIESGLDDDQGARADRRHQGADGDGPGDGSVSPLLTKLK